MFPSYQKEIVEATAGVFKSSPYESLLFWIREVNAIFLSFFLISNFNSKQFFKTSHICLFVINRDIIPMLISKI